MEKIDWNEYFCYDETSPSCLRWKVSRGSNKVRAGDVAGGCISSTGYYQCILQGKNYKCHRIIYEMFNNISLKPNEQIDHINRQKTDNRIDNLRVVTSAQNARNRFIQRDNSTGMSGVCETSKGDSYYYTAHWCDLVGKLHQKHFSIAKLGREIAFAKAVAYRKKMIAELNEQGAGYSDRHGT